MLLLPADQPLTVNRGSQRAPSPEIRNQHLLPWRNNRSRLSHEMHATKHDHVSICPTSSLRQSQAIPDKIRNILNLRNLIIVRENHRVPLTLQTENLLNQLRMTIPVDTASCLQEKTLQ